MFRKFYDVSFNKKNINKKCTAWSIWVEVFGKSSNSRIWKKKVISMARRIIVKFKKNIFQNLYREEFYERGGFIWKIFGHEISRLDEEILLFLPFETYLSNFIYARNSAGRQSLNPRHIGHAFL